MNSLNIRNEYPFLWTICRIFHIVGMVLIAVSIIGVIIGIVSLIVPSGYMVSPIFIGGSIGIFLIIAVPLFVSEELIKIFIRIELNTRKDNTVYSEDFSELSHGKQKHKKNLVKEEEFRPQSYMEWECPKCKAINASSYDTCVSCGYSLP